MRRIVINRCYGGFGLSQAALSRYRELTGGEVEPNEYYLDRDDPLLVQVVEELGCEANGEFALLKIVEIPEDVQWSIDEYDGLEHVAELHRIWD